MQTDDKQHRSILQRIAHRVMRDRGLLPDFSSEAAAVKGLEENLHMQDRAAQSMKNLRHVHGVLSFETVEARPVFDGDEIRDLEVEKRNRAMMSLRPWRNIAQKKKTPPTKWNGRSANPLLPFSLNRGSESSLTLL